MCVYTVFIADAFFFFIHIYSAIWKLICLPLSVGCKIPVINSEALVAYKTFGTITLGSKSNILTVPRRMDWKSTQMQLKAASFSQYTFPDVVRLCLCLINNVHWSSTCSDMCFNWRFHSLLLYSCSFCCSCSFLNDYFKLNQIMQCVHVRSNEISWMLDIS